MKIIYKESFIQRIENQIDYIAISNPDQAKRFKSELINRIKQIPLNPYQYCKSIYFEDICIRDLIFKGYTVVFRIDETTIQIFGFVKYQDSPI
jgi:plasmid stabilization system protein ParE